MKKSHQEIVKEREAKYSAIKDELGIFFAFGQAQFDEKKVEGINYVSGAYGECIPKENVQTYLTRMKELVEETKKAFTESVNMDDYIRYELANHEAWYTGDISDAINAVLPYFPDVTEADVWKVYHANKKEYDEHN